MGTKSNPGPIDCYAAALPDEPIFVLLARDEAAPGAIEDWADLRGKMIRHGQKPASDWHLIFEARAVAQFMREWRREHWPQAKAAIGVEIASPAVDPDAQDEWPAEPWVVSGPGEPDPQEIGMIFQEGEVEAIVQVDPNRENDDAYVQSTARRICACVNAMAGIEDPEAWVALVKMAMQFEADDMEAVGRALMASIEAYKDDPFMEGWAPADNPAEIVGDLLNEIERVTALLNAPVVDDFLEGVRIEAAHQVQRWGAAHDRSKSAENWFFLIGYLAGKALRSAIEGDRDKAMHHTISSAAALFQWHKALAAGAGNVGSDADLTPESEPA